MNRERAIWGAAAAVLAVAALIQTMRLEVSRAEILKWRDKASWPDRPVEASVETLAPGAFKPVVQATIPQEFWGEFAEDTNVCGSETSILIASAKITEGENITTVVRVHWTDRGKLKIEATDRYALDTSFRMEMTQDRAEITLVHSNRKRVVQRCSMRAHPAPEPVKSVNESVDAMLDDVVADDAMAADANTIVDADD